MSTYSSDLALQYGALVAILFSNITELMLSIYSVINPKY